MPKHQKQDGKSDRELDEIAKGGKGSGDKAAEALSAWRKDVDSEPLNIDPDRK